jgi:predicted NBD/HSP70 family sugar kinase
VFEAAELGDRRARRVVDAEARLVARAICSIVAVVDTELVVLGGGIGTAAGFVDAVSREVASIAAIPVDVRVTALGSEAVVDGCLASGLARAWELLTADGRR